MKPFVWLSGTALAAFVLLCTGSKPAPSPVKEEYQQAVVAAERALQAGHHDRAALTLVTLRKTLNEPLNLTQQARVAAQFGAQWEVEYLDKKCLDDRGLRSCKGGGVVVTVNLRTNHSKVYGLE